MTTTSVADTTVATAPPPASLTSSTTIASTTLPATTTTVPTEDLITQAVQDYFAAYHLCGVMPSTCLPDTFTAVHGHSRSTLLELSTGMVQQGLYFLADSRGSYLVAESVSLVSATEATATYCAYDAGTVMGPDGPDGLPTIVNDEILNVRYEYRLYREGGRWLVGGQREIQQLGQGSLCPPSE
ncbi:MAG: hypothetical protein ABI894_08480 [Ilumatobacteraceae bacterium]